LPGHFDGHNLVGLLSAVHEEVIRSKQALLRAYAPMLQYPHPKMQAKKEVSSRRDGGTAGTTMEANAVSLALDRLAADVATG